MEIIYKRRSCRNFCKGRRLPQDLVKKIISAGDQAPSGKNGQPWKFAVVESENLIVELGRLSIYKKVIKNSSCLILVFLDKEKSYEYKKDILAIGACIQNILLAACSQGIASCWNGDILRNADKVNEILNISPNCELMSMIVLGYEDLDKTKYIEKVKRDNVDEKIDIWV